MEIVSPRLEPICSKIYLLFLPKLPKIFTHYSYFIPIAPPIISFLFYCVSDTSQCKNDLQSRFCLLTALIQYVTVLLKYLDFLQTRWHGTVNIWEGSVRCAFWLHHCLKPLLSCVLHVSAILVSVLCLYTA